MIFLEPGVSNLLLSFSLMQRVLAILSLFMPSIMLQPESLDIEPQNAVQSSYFLLQIPTQYNIRIVRTATFLLDHNHTSDSLIMRIPYKIHTDNGKYDLFVYEYKVLHDFSEGSIIPWQAYYKIAAPPSVGSVAATWLTIFTSDGVYYFDKEKGIIVIAQDNGSDRELPFNNYMVPEKDSIVRIIGLKNAMFVMRRTDTRYFSYLLSEAKSVSHIEVSYNLPEYIDSKAYRRVPPISTWQRNGNHMVAMVFAPAEGYEANRTNEPIVINTYNLYDGDICFESSYIINLRDYHIVIPNDPVAEYLEQSPTGIFGTILECYEITTDIVFFGFLRHAMLFDTKNNIAYVLAWHNIVGHMYEEWVNMPDLLNYAFDGRNVYILALVDNGTNTHIVVTVKDVSEIVNDVKLYN